MADAEIEPIFRAVRRGEVDEVARLLDAEPHLMEARNPRGFGHTALIMAAGLGHADLVKLLLERGADVNAGNVFDDTALHEAAAGGHEEVVSILLGCGADRSRKGDTSDITPLISASHNCHLDVARQLQIRECGLDQRNHIGWTALFEACLNGHVEVARTLLLAGADHSTADNAGDTPRQAAEEHGHPECVALLEVSWRVCYLLARRHHLSRPAPFYGSGGRGSWSVAM
jgi:ankyrin repeat protein